MKSRRSRAWWRGRACRRVRALVPLAAGRDVSGAEAWQLWSHLADCPSCRREHRGYVEMRAALEDFAAAARTVAPCTVAARGAATDEVFFAGLSRDIMDAVAEPVAAAPRFSPRLFWGSALAAALFLVGLVLASTGLLRGVAGSGEASPLLTRDRMPPLAGRAAEPRSPRVLLSQPGTAQLATRPSQEVFSRSLSG